MSRFEDMQYFLAVVDAGSISAAAETLGVSVAAVSKRLKHLEAALGTRLLTRNTRNLALTEAGRYYQQHCRTILEEVTRVDQHLQAMQGRISGSLRINMPMTYGKLRLMPVLVRFMRQHPDIQLDLHLDDAYVDVARGDYDVVIRVGQLEDSGLIARKLEDCYLLAAASADYLAQYGVPQHPEELLAHQCLRYSNLSRRDGWLFYGAEGEEIRIHPAESCLAVNNGEALLAAARGGLGVILIPDFALQQDLNTERLQEILADFAKPSVSVYAVYPSRQFLPEKTRVLIEFLQAELQVC